MAARKRTNKRLTKTKRATRKKATPSKKVNRSEKLRKRKLAPKRAAAEKTSRRKQPWKRSVGTLPYPSQPRGSPSGEQSGDLQGLSRREGADMESVEELLEEGNAFEADAVIGVEKAESEDEKEVRTREVPEDDVPDEYSE
jgi:hypothetical protein